MNVKSYTDIEQSKKLTEILPLETADMCFTNDGTAIKIDANSYNVRKHMWKGEGVQLIPCWSLAALLSVLPKYEIYNNGETIQLDVNLEALATEGDETLLDLVVNMIIHLHELNLLRL